MKTLSEFEALADHEFSQYVLEFVTASSDEEADHIIVILFTLLEKAALDEGVEVCPRSAHLLVLALFDTYTFAHTEELHVPDDYFQDQQHPKQPEVREYLEERRLGAPPRHGNLTVN
jgi:hypothetical protein